MKLTRKDHGFQMKTEMNEAKDNPRKALVCVALALGLGTALLYWPVVTFDYVTLDDSTYLINNFHVNRGLHLGRLALVL